MRNVVNALIRCYQWAVSPLLGGWCRYQPSCSEYTRRAVLVHGVIKGLAMGSWRILRCHPLSRGGWDPVPRSESGEPEGPSLDDPVR